MMVRLNKIIQIIFMHIQNIIVYRCCYLADLVDTTSSLPVITTMQMTIIYLIDSIVFIYLFLFIQDRKSTLA